MCIRDSFETEGNYGWGEVVVTLTPTIFKKIKLATHENAGFGQISLPEEQTVSYTHLDVYKRQGLFVRNRKRQKDPLF